MSLPIRLPVSEPAPTPSPAPGATEWRGLIGQRSVVLVGMMGSGKSTVGARLAQKMGLKFVDADSEIEIAAGMSIPDIFATRGEAEFRAGERRVIARLLTQGPRVIATGGGAYLNDETRARIKAHGVSIWLKADVDTLMRRVRKRSNRPLLQTADPEATLKALLAAREPVYALADITVMSQDDPHDLVVDAVLAALGDHIATEPGKASS